MEDGTLAETIEAICTDDFVWANSGLRTLNGKADVFASIQSGGFANEIPILEAMTSFSVDLSTSPAPATWCSRNASTTTGMPRGGT